jgi:anthranilate synthase component 2
MQAIAVFYGGNLFNMTDIVHGQNKKLQILLKEFYLFRGVPDLTEVGLYHSWAVNPGGLPDCLEVSAISENGLIMSLHHKNYDICGVQFHPESIITREGLLMLSNWINH